MDQIPGPMRRPPSGTASLPKRQRHQAGKVPGPTRQEQGRAHSRAREQMTGNVGLVDAKDFTRPRPRNQAKLDEQDGINDLRFCNSMAAFFRSDLRA
jgi:hypothetical protein